MDHNANRFICALWVSAAIFIAARYIAAACLAAGSFGDPGIWQQSVDALGPFLPILSTVCLLGGTAFAVIEAVFAIKNRKK